MKRKLFLVALSSAMSLMVWQMVIAKAPIVTGTYQMAYISEPDTSKKDSLEVVLTAPVEPVIFSRKMIPPEVQPPIEKPKTLAKSKRKKKEASLVSEATPKQ